MRTRLTERLFHINKAISETETEFVGGNTVYSDFKTAYLKAKEVEGWMGYPGYLTQTTIHYSTDGDITGIDYNCEISNKWLREYKLLAGIEDTDSNP